MLTGLLRLGLAALAFLLFIVIAVAAALLWFDPSAHLPRANAWLSEAVGAPVEIQGEVTLALLPRPAISADRVSVGDVDPLDGAVLHGLRADVHLLSLLSGEPVLRRVWIEHLTADTAVGHVQGSDIELLEAGLNTEARLRMNLSLDHTSGNTATGTFAARLRPDPDANSLQVQIDDLSLHVGNGSETREGWPLTLQGLVGLNQPDREVTLQDVQLQAAEIAVVMTGALRAEADGYSALGRLAIESDNFRAGLQRLFGFELDAEDDTALRRVSLESGFRLESGEFAFRDADLRVDEASAEASIRYTGGEDPLLQFDAAIIDLEADRYTPEEVDPAIIRFLVHGLLDLASAMRLDGSLDFNALTSLGLVLDRLQLGVTSDRSTLRFEPARADLYGGSIHGNLRADLGSEPEQARMDLSIVDVDLAELQNVLFDLVALDARVDADLRARFIAREPADFLDSLDLEVDLLLREGEILGFSLKDMVEDAVPRALGGQDRDAFADGAGTRFTNLTGDLTLRDRQLRNDEAQARSDHFRADGQGELSLPGGELDYRIDLTLVEAFDTPSETLLGWLEGRSVPLRLHGPLNDLSLDVEWGDDVEDLEDEPSAGAH